MPDTSPIAIVLAAGKGTRMNSDLPKVLHKAAGKTLLAWVLDALNDAGCHKQIVVVGYGGEEVRAHIGTRPGVQFAIQHKQLGTGDAVRAAVPLIESTLATGARCGKIPLVRASSQAVGARPDWDPLGYRGRRKRTPGKEDGRVLGTGHQGPV